MAISLEINSKGLVLSQKKEEHYGLLFTSPTKHEIFQAVVGQQRPRTKKRDARANCFANLNLLLLTVSFVAIVFA